MWTEDIRHFITRLSMDMLRLARFYLHLAVMRIHATKRNLWQTGVLRNSDIDLLAMTWKTALEKTLSHCIVCSNSTPLINASFNGHLNVIKLLIKAGAKILTKNMCVTKSLNNCIWSYISHHELKFRQRCHDVRRRGQPHRNRRIIIQRIVSKIAWATWNICGSVCWAT